MSGFFLGLLARVWLWTLRVDVEMAPELVTSTEPWVLSFFHGTQWPLLAWKRRRTTAVMVSLSRDGRTQARALARLGFSVVRGSSSRGGARGLASLIRALKAGRDVAFAVDGPRGPCGIPKPGAALAARRAGALLVPMGSAMQRGHVFERAWDRFALAWPFSRVAVVLGAPTSEAELGAAITAANARAQAKMVPSNRNLPDVGTPIE